MTANLPFVSVVIPALNSEATIATCLESIKSQNYPHGKLEIIVVDNGSKDRTDEIAREYGARIFYKPLIKVGALRNSGARVARGDVIAFTDSDCVVPRDWLIKGIEILNDDSVGAVGGGCLVPPHASWLERAWVFGQNDLTKESKYLPASNFILRKDIFDKMGGFDESIFSGEDDDLSIRLRKQGYKLITHNSCFVIHLGYPKSLINVLKRQVWHGKSILETRASIFDKMFILTHLYAICLFILPFAILTASISEVLLISLSSWLLFVPILSAGHRTYRSLGKGNDLSTISRFIYLIPIFLFFFVGRSLGLVYNYKDVITKCLKPRNGKR